MIVQLVVEPMDRFTALASSVNTDTFLATMSCTELQSAAVITSLRFNPDTRIRDLIIGQPGLLTRYADDDSNDDGQHISQGKQNLS